MGGDQFSGNLLGKCLQSFSFNDRLFFLLQAQNTNMSDDEFKRGDSDGVVFYTEFADSGTIRPGSFIIMKENFPCKVTAFLTVKPGKHGSTKVIITAKDIFTDKQYE